MNEQTPPQHAQKNEYLGLARLMTMTYHGKDMGPLAEQLLARANTGNDAEAMMDLSILLQLRGDPETGLAVQEQALRMQQIYTLPARTQPPAIRLLAIKAPGEMMWNTPLEFLVEDSDIEVSLLHVSTDLPLPESLPEHDVMMVAMAQCRANGPLLEILQDVVAGWPRPVINAPESILKLTRDNCSQLLAGVPGVLMPQTVSVERHTLESVCQQRIAMAALLEDGDFPVIIRPVDSHAGQALERVDSSQALQQYLAQNTGQEFYISRFVDYRDEDGLYYKCRVAMIDGEPYASHMAVSDHWMIHYLNAGMAEDAQKRAEEAAFMSGFDSGFAARHREALMAINDRLALDYFAIDCAETADGQLLVFEADSAMVVHAMDPIEDFPYKHEYMPRVFQAFRQLLEQRRSRGAIA